ncbi:hypothetical protein ARHIZOSPH14_15140 [Agromyces rhizosphaerae]|uniref:SRPBCC family protein n=1 Tax=Agromyces rhizosphaerae TaxID=88374 RepID=A0A9W6FR39_9MICO|nr:SRPBCC family protein [Agromyces rhizosphaerae]GLI27272.1 hypothetical protein ARHIZOSPH14_15140 [Agromyces rhizosphaerae]
MNVITSDTTITRPPDQVFEYLADASRLPEWQPSVEEASAEPAGVFEVGVKGSERRRTPGGVQTIHWEVTECEPGALWAVQGTDGPVRAHTAIALTAVDGGTRVDYRIWFEGRGIGKVIAKLATRGARTEVPESLALLKQHLEVAGG